MMMPKGRIADEMAELNLPIGRALEGSSGYLIAFRNLMLIFTFHHLIVS